MEYRKIERIPYNLHIIKTDKFKKNMIKINFKNKLVKEEVDKRRLIPDILVEANGIYNTKRLLDIRTEELYNLQAYGDVTISGNTIITSFCGIFLNDKYGEDGLLEDSIKFMFDIIFNPIINDNKFDTKSFLLAKKNLKEQIESLKENPREYALERMLEELGPDTSLSIHTLGYINDLDDINESNLYEYYQYMLKSDIVDIFVIGDFDFEKVENIVKDNFKVNTVKRNKYSHFIEHKKYKNKYKEVKEEIDNNQSILLLGYKLKDLTKFERDYVLPVYSYILGGGPDSKLFKNVREKNSLCYFISSTIRSVSNVMLINAGINSKDYKKAVSLIKKEVVDMSKGIFEQSDIEKAIITYLNAYKEIEDSMGSIINTYTVHEYLGIDLLNERAKQIVKVTKQDIINVASKIHPEVCYFLEGVKHDEEE